MDSTPQAQRSSERKSLALRPVKRWSGDNVKSTAYLDSPGRLLIVELEEVSQGKRIQKAQES